jgi:hypothetical protein
MEQKKRNCFKKVFEKDSIFGNIRNHASETMPISKAITNYSVNLKSLDYSHCPEEFESAFQKHIEAWLNFREVSDKYPSLRGELHDIFSIIEKGKDSTEFRSRLKQILETWKMVKQISNEQ